MTTIGQKLRGLIQEQNVKQVKLADAVGLSASRLSNYLSDKREPDLEMLASMAKYLGVDLNYFSHANFTTQEPAIVQFIKQNEAVCVPCFRISDKKRAQHRRHILLDRCLIKDIDNPVIIEIKREIKGVCSKNAYILASPINDYEKNGTLVIETGRNFNIYTYIEHENGCTLYNIRSKACISIQQDKLYYAVRWILQ